MEDILYNRDSHDNNDNEELANILCSQLLGRSVDQAHELVVKYNQKTNKSYFLDIQEICDTSNPLAKDKHSISSIAKTTDKTKIIAYAHDGFIYEIYSI
jgi:hypothetical protein